MSLPDLIEIVPLNQPVKAEITVPGSKSITNRALILAALANGPVTLTGALWSEDTQVMVECLHTLGFDVKVAPDPQEFCNRIITVQGLGGKIPRAGSAEKPLDLFVGNAGTAARFLSALVCLGNGVYRLHGIDRMHQRPQAALFQALRELGCRVDSESGQDTLPATIYGTGPRSTSCTVSITESSQFASALLLCAKHGGWQVKVVGENAEESPYVAMTIELIKAFPFAGGSFQIEPDASSGSYFWAVRRFLPWMKADDEEWGGFGDIKVPTWGLAKVSVAHWPASGWQIDQQFESVIAESSAMVAGLSIASGRDSISDDQLDALVEELPNQKVSRSTNLGDSIMTAIVLAPFSIAPVYFTDLGRLRVQECERVIALRTELTKCGAKVIEEGDTLTVYPSKLHGAEIESYNDHRMAMCFAILGLKVPGLKIKNPACVKKTFPNFFQKLAAAPPHGLGATILDATGRKLSHDELFAD